MRSAHTIALFLALTLGANACGKGSGHAEKGHDEKGHDEKGEEGHEEGRARAGDAPHEPPDELGREPRDLRDHVDLVVAGRAGEQPRDLTGLGRAEDPERDRDLGDAVGRVRAARPDDGAALPGDLVVTSAGGDHQLAGERAPRQRRDESRRRHVGEGSLRDDGHDYRRRRLRSSSL